jgi:hypothetical protein
MVGLRNARLTISWASIDALVPRRPAAATREGRIQSIAAEIEDRPGFLACIAQSISEAGGNILEVQHDRMATDLSAKSATLAITFEARDAVHAMAIRQRLTGESVTVCAIAPSLVGTAETQNRENPRFFTQKSLDARPNLNICAALFADASLLTEIFDVAIWSPGHCQG